MSDNILHSDLYAWLEAHPAPEPEPAALIEEAPEVIRNVARHFGFDPKQYTWVNGGVNGWGISTYGIYVYFKEATAWASASAYVPSAGYAYSQSELAEYIRAVLNRLDKLSNEKQQRAQDEAKKHAANPLMKEVYICETEDAPAAFAEIDALLWDNWTLHSMHPETPHSYLTYVLVRRPEDVK